MRNTNVISTRLLAAMMVGVVLLSDQISKWWLLEQFAGMDHPMREVTSFFNVVLVRNTGVSFGLFAALRQPMVLTAVSGVIIAILLCWLMKNPTRLVGIALGCVIGGAVGNVIDRLRFGAVTDFLDFHWNAYHWPAFNIADSAIFIGVVLLAVSSMFEPHCHSEHKEPVV